MSNKYTSTLAPEIQKRCSRDGQYHKKSTGSILELIESLASRKFVCKYSSNATCLLGRLLLGHVGHLRMPSFERCQLVDEFLSCPGFVLLHFWIRCLHSQTHKCQTSQQLLLLGKLAPCGTDIRLLLQAKFFQVQSHVKQKLGQISKIRPEQI